MANIPDFGVKHVSRSGLKPESGIAVRSKVWLEKDGKLFMGWGRATLLERIDQLGSITAAAKSMHLTYRNAWLWIEAMNRLAAEPLVEKFTEMIRQQGVPAGVGVFGAHMLVEIHNDGPVTIWLER